MTHRHLAVHEWGRIKVGPGGFTRPQANALIASARAHRLGGDDGTRILTDHHSTLRVRQAVGMISAAGCSLEILPKVDPQAPDEDAQTVRRHLVHLLDVAHDLNIGDGIDASMARQHESLLDVLIRIFSERLLAETRRGLPRAYVAHEDDLPALRGRLDLVRQFTIHALRPDRLACRFDELTSDIALMQVLKAAVVFLGNHARAPDLRRLLDQLRFVLGDVGDVQRPALPWDRIRFDRTNRRWHAPFKLARMFLRLEWQATHHDAARDGGITLLFPMNDLFERYVAAMLRRALAGSDVEVISQGGRHHCLGDWIDGEDCDGVTFQTRPDILLKRGGSVVAIIDTKWKAIAANPLDNKQGVSQADVYQMMAYARVYHCDRLLLLYPESPGAAPREPHSFGIHLGRELLAVGKIDISTGAEQVTAALGALAEWLVPAINATLPRLLFRQTPERYQSPTRTDKAWKGNPKKYASFPT